MAGGWIKLYRKMSEWEWFRDSHTVHLFICLLLSAETEERERRGISLRRGQVLTSLDDLAGRTGMSVRNVRTAMAKLEAADVVRRRATNRFSIVTVLNFDCYQMPQNAASAGTADNQVTSQATSSGRPQHIDGTHITKAGTVEVTSRASRNRQAGQEKEKCTKEKEYYQEEKNIYNTTTGMNINSQNAQAGARTREGGSFSIRSLEAAGLELERERWYEIFFWANALHPRDEVSRFVRHNERYGWSSPTTGRVFATADARLALAEQWAENGRCAKGRDRNLKVWRSLYERTTAVRPELGRRFLDTRNSIEADNAGHRAVFHFHRDLCAFFSETDEGRRIMAETVPGFRVEYSTKIQKR